MKKTLLFFVMTFLSLGVQAQECLTPISQSEQRFWGKDNFEGLYNEDANQQFLFFPSFWGSQALYIYSSGKKAGTLAVKEKPVRRKGEVADTSLDSVSLHVDVATAERLGNLLQHAVNTSNYLYERTGLDGAQYFFFDRFNGATCWSPVGSCGRMVEMLWKVINAVQAGDQTLINAQLPAIDSLTTHFKNQYPEAFFHHISISCWGESDMGTDKHHINLVAGLDGRLSLQFTYLQPYAEELPGQLHARYSPMLEKLLRHLFMDTALLDSGYFSILVNDEKPQSLTRNHNFYTLTVHHKDLTFKRLRQIIDEKWNALMY